MGNSGSSSRGNPLSAILPKPKDVPVVNAKPSQLDVNLKETADLLGKYADNNMAELVKFIRKDEKLLKDMGISPEQNAYIFQMVANYEKLFDDNTEGKDNIAAILKGTNFYEYFQKIEESELQVTKKNIIDSELVEMSGEKQNIEKIFGNITKLRAKEQYFKYQYLLSQIWILAYVSKMNSTITEFSEKTLKLFQSNEEKRNAHVREMLSQLIAILIGTDNDLSEQDFKVFKDQMAVLEGKLQKNSVDLHTSLQKTQTGLTGILGSVSTSTVSQQSRKQPGLGDGGGKKKQKGGFVRDASRFPQAFYDLSNE